MQQQWWERCFETAQGNRLSLVLGTKREPPSCVFKLQHKSVFQEGPVEPSNILPPIIFLHIFSRNYRISALSKIKTELLLYTVDRKEISLSGMSWTFYSSVCFNLFNENYCDLSEMCLVQLGELLRSIITSEKNRLDGVTNLLLPFWYLFTSSNSET